MRLPSPHPRAFHRLGGLGVLLGLAGPAWPQTPPKSSPPVKQAIVYTRQDAVALVHKAIAYYQAHGRKQMIAEVSRSTSSLRHGALYVFVYDMEGRVVAHGQFARLAGYDLSAYRDPNGKSFIQERLRLAREKGSGWQDYQFLDPVTRKWQDKSAYIQVHDGLIFGCGIYKT